MRWLTALLMWGGSAVTICICRCGGLRDNRRRPWGTYDALWGAYGGGFGRRHSWLVTEKRVVGLIEITAWTATLKT